MPERYSPKHCLQLVLCELLRKVFARRTALFGSARDDLDPTLIDIGGRAPPSSFDRGAMAT